MIMIILLLIIIIIIIIIDSRARFFAAGDALLHRRAGTPASSDLSYGDLTTTSPTTVSDKPLMCLKQYIARGVKFNVSCCLELSR